MSVFPKQSSYHQHFYTEFTQVGLEGAVFSCIINLPKLGGIAQLGERLPCTQEVSGSSPLTSTQEKEAPGQLSRRFYNFVL